MPMHPAVTEITQRISERSREQRTDYLARMNAVRTESPARRRLSCSNFAHVFAAAGADKPALRGNSPNIGIVTAYNDMLSAHQPFERYPDIIRAAARDAGATAQVAGGVPAMCDGVTQGQPGMELSLFSRDVIALATAVALSHDSFDAGLLLGVCDKIVPGLFIGAASFGHLPFLFVPAGPMTSGISNAEKARVRQAFAEGRASRDELLEVEAASYHSPGTCTFYGTANSNQLLMEAMGLMVPGAAFVNSGTPLRDALTRAAAWRAITLARSGAEPASFAEIVDERSIVNAVVTLMATGGSTNHTLHLVAMARAVGLALTWQDMSDLSAVTPLLARVYPNGSADVNHFEAAGGFAFLARELLAGGLLHANARTVWGDSLAPYAMSPAMDGSQLTWRVPPAQTGDPEVLRRLDTPFNLEGGLRLLNGNLGQAMVKVSAVKQEHWAVEAPARVFESQAQVEEAFKRGDLDEDLVAIVRFQGPRANGMPELHKLTPLLASLQDRGRKVALVTDGRMSGASGKVLAAIHVTPEALDGGPLARVMDGDPIRVDARQGTLSALLPDQTLASRTPAVADTSSSQWGVGRDLFSLMRRNVGSAERGASFLFGD